MAIYSYDYRVHTNNHYDQSKVMYPPLEPKLKRFTHLVWHGQDDEGYCVYRKDNYTNKIVRIDFY